MRNRHYLLIAVLLLFVIFMTFSYREGFFLQPMNFQNVPEAKARQSLMEKRFGLNSGTTNENFQLPQFSYTVDYLKQALPQQKQLSEQEILVRGYANPYDSPYRYPNAILPAHTIGCGHRNGACMGGSEIPIPNTLPPVNISEQNIAPINLTVRGFDEGIQQVGTIQKVFGKDNFIYPLFGRRRFRNDNKWDYYVKFGEYGVILPVLQRHPYEQLSTNDEVKIQGQSDKYRVIIYEDDIPQYLPYT